MKHPQEKQKLKELYEEIFKEKGIYENNFYFFQKQNNHAQKLGAFTKERGMETYDNTFVPLAQKDMPLWVKEAVEAKLILKKEDLEEGECYFGDHRCTEIALWKEGKFHYVTNNSGFLGTETTDYPGEAHPNCHCDCFTPFFKLEIFKWNNPRWVNLNIKMLIKEKGIKYA